MLLIIKFTINICVADKFPSTFINAEEEVVPLVCLSLLFTFVDVRVSELLEVVGVVVASSVIVLCKACRIAASDTV